MKMFHFRGKAQMEILGLSIVIVLLVLVGLIAVKFFLNKEPSETRKRFVESELASSFLSTILKTSSQCRKTSFEELLQDCATMKSIDCSGENSCEYAERNIADILQNSLGTQEKDYRLNITKASGTIVEFNEIMRYDSTGFCRNYKSKVWPLPLSSDTMIVRLDICS